MKSTLRLTLAAMLLGLSATFLLRAEDQTVPPPPAQTGQPTPPAPDDMPPHPRMHNPHQMLQMLTERLNLTIDQQAKIFPLLQAQAQQAIALRNDTSLPDDQKREQLRSIRQSTFRQIRALLTSEQLQKFASLRFERGGPPPPPNGNPPPADRVPPQSGNPPPPVDGPTPPSN
ncbi:MAG: hypothetical protein ABSE59_04880 [Opitutaceae bacterium]|jgi:Spy/CpxP family protein refolding chaperone